MRVFLASDPDLTAPILAATKAFDPLLNVRTQMYISEQRYLNGTTYEDIARIAREVVSASKADLLSLCETLDKCALERNITVIAGKHMLDACEGLEITEI
jgi:Zn-dependent M16 (insulinase) family peptidase